MSAVKEFRCAACGAEFDSQSRLDHHRRELHPEISEHQSGGQGLETDRDIEEKRGGQG